MFAPSPSPAADTARSSSFLAELEVLVLDCQTTGATPARGRVLEVAWSRGRAAEESWGAEPEVVSHLVRLPRGERLPPRIAKLTGVRPRELARSLPQEEVRRRLEAEVKGLRSASPAGRATAVIHFARFERAFLEDEWIDDEALDFLCTHEIACRLLPGLPRRGLRAVAGHLGHVMTEEKRAGSHVRATISVWCALVWKLRERGVETVADLDRWLREEKPVRRGGREFSLPREERLGLPDAPGVYRMRGRGGEVLYVGKATSLKSRVNSYFQNRHRRPGGDRTLEMLTQVWGVDVTPCDTALEAALRETDLIKEHAPPYNVALRGREAATYFADPDRESVRPVADAGHRLGPLPRRDSLAALTAQRRLLGDELTPTERDGEWLAALGLGAPVSGEDGRLDRRQLDPTGLREGFALYRARAGWKERTEIAWPELLRIGGRFWREHLAEGRDRAAAEEAEPDPAGEDRPRDPEEVARWFALALGRCSQLVRRGKWFERLCESSLWWCPRAGSAQRLLVEGGEIRSCGAAEDAPPGERAPIPAGAARPLRERRRCLDVATYDRLRVLTTELRRILAEGAEVELRLGSGLPLDRDTLARRLQGV